MATYAWAWRYPYDDTPTHLVTFSNDASTGFSGKSANTAYEWTRPLTDVPVPRHIQPETMNGGIRDYEVGQEGRLIVLRFDLVGLPNGSEPYTRVIVSGYALYGKLRGFYALGVAHWQLDRSSGRLFMSEASQRNSEPVSSLSSAQRAIIRECLIDLNPEAWETSNASFRNQLET